MYCVTINESEKKRKKTRANRFIEFALKLPTNHGNLSQNFSLDIENKVTFRKQCYDSLTRKYRLLMRYHRQVSHREFANAS